MPNSAFETDARKRRFAPMLAPFNADVGHLENGGIMKLKTSVAIFLMFIVAETAVATEPYNYAELWRS